MVSETGDERNAGEGTYARALASLQRWYEELDARLSRHSPYVVRTGEVILAVVLLAFLAHWLYMFYTA